MTHNLGVDVLEELIETKLSETLSTVTNQSWSEASQETCGSLSGSDGLETVAQRCVELWVDLSSALDEIHRGDGCVGESASQGTSNHALEVVGSVVFVACHGNVLYNYLEACLICTEALIQKDGCFDDAL